MNERRIIGNRRAIFVGTRHTHLGYGETGLAVRIEDKDWKRPLWEFWPDRQELELQFVVNRADLYFPQR